MLGSNRRECRLHLDQHRARPIRLRRLLRLDATRHADIVDRDPGPHPGDELLCLRPSRRKVAAEGRLVRIRRHR